MVIEPAFGTFGSVGRCQVLLENEISISIKLVSRRKQWSALKYPDRWLHWLWTSENTVDQHQQMTWQPKSSLTVETSHWTSSNMDSVPLHSSSRLWDLEFQMKCKIYFHLKRGLWTTEQQSRGLIYKMLRKNHPKFDRTIISRICVRLIHRMNVRTENVRTCLFQMWNL